jgi:hypothetical protein
LGLVLAPPLENGYASVVIKDDTNDEIETK